MAPTLMPEKEEAPSRPSAARRESRVMDILYRQSSAALALLTATLLACTAGGAQRSETVSIAAVPDEPRGWLVIEGGSYPIYAAVAEKFRELIGGADSKVLLVPTALADSEMSVESRTDGARGTGELMGLRNYEIFNTHDRTRANSEEFANRIRTAKGIWFNGGRPGRIAEAYLDTRTHRELLSFYKKGGVVGGSSAGAMILSSFLVRGGIENEDFRNYISQKNRVGLGFLPNAAIDVHIGQRPNGEADLTQIVSAYPGVLGIGVEAGVAAVVHGHELEVVGRPRGRVAITDGQLHDGKPYFFLKPGDRYDLVQRGVISPH